MTKKQVNNILVPVDGSRATPIVLKAGIKAAISENAHLDLLQIVILNQVIDNYNQAQRQNSADATYLQVKLATERLNDLKQQALSAGVKSCDIHIRFGSPKRVIAREFPKDHPCNLIVMGSTGMSRIERTLLGSVTSYVIRHAVSDVMVVHINK